MSALLGGVGLGVVLRCFVGVGLGVNGVAMRRVRMMSGGLVIACLMVFGRFAMMLSGRFVVFCGFRVVCGALMFRHCHLLSIFDTCLPTTTSASTPSARWEHGSKSTT